MTSCLLNYINIEQLPTNLATILLAIHWYSLIYVILQNLTLYGCRVGCSASRRATCILSSYSYSVHSILIQWSSFSRGDTLTKAITVDKCFIRLSQRNTEFKWVTGDSGKPFPHNGASVWGTWVVCIWTPKFTTKRLWKTCRVVGIYYFIILTILHHTSRWSQWPGSFHKRSKHTLTMLIKNFSPKIDIHFR